MNSIYINTSIAEAKSNYDDAMLEYEYTDAIYRQTFMRFRTAREIMLAAKQTFADMIDTKIAANIANAVLKFLSGIAGAVHGAGTGDFGSAVGGVVDAIEGIQSLDLNLFKLYDLVSSIEKFINIADDNMVALQDMTTPYDDQPYKAEIEKIATLHTQITEWENLHSVADSILTVDDLQYVGDTSSADFGKALKDLSNWGQPLSESIIERAEKTREAIAWRVTLDMRLQQQKNAADAVNEMREGEDEVARAHALEMMRQQAYSVVADLNDVLISFCQAYFFDTLKECEQAFRPNFGGSLSDVLQRVTRVRRQALLALPPHLASTTTVDVIIADTNQQLDCNDIKTCPINYFKEHDELYYKVRPGDEGLVGLQQFRVSEVLLDFEGARATGDRPYLSVGIVASGQFKGVSFNTTYDFLGDPIALEYEYDVQLGIRESFGIRKRADIYNRYRGTVPHMTPYTTWYIRLNRQRTADVDLPNVARIRVYFRGSTSTTAGKRPSRVRELTAEEI